ncbi:MAG: HDOD domain-containing protein [Thermodesulfobacteriota bacterium]|nr:HDOD domain-containing protein [Thermodesulfobacteriota bacterium]
MQEKTEVKRRVKRIKNLPTLPGIVQKISGMVESPHTSSSDVARLISQDQVLSAKVLRMANSAFFGMSRKISSITQALVILGFDVVKGLVLTSSVFEMMKQSMAGLWEHSVGCAAASGVIARRLGRPDAEEVLVAGLLHDLGKVVLSLEMPEEMAVIMKEAQTKQISFYETEGEVLGFNHQDVGLWLSEHWNLPDNLSEPMRYHHQPERAVNAVQETAIVHLADIIIRAKGFGFGGDDFVPPLSAPAWKILGLKTGDFGGLIDELEPKLLNIGDYM